MITSSRRMDGARHSSSASGRSVVERRLRSRQRPASMPNLPDAGAPSPWATVALVVPSRNESAHIESFLKRVKEALAPFPIDWHAEVMDDSEDETLAILTRLAGRGAPIQVTHREEPAHDGALGEAIRAGLARARGEIVCVMDADLQHPPEILPELLAPIVLGRADICVGSRYRRGGSAAGLESRWRRLAARVSGAIVRWLFPATRLTTDPGSGLFAVRREVLDSVHLRRRGSRVLAEILVRARWQNVCDVPYRFAATDEGSSPLGLAAAGALARELLSLRFLPCDGLRDHRRVAPVHRELLRAP
jgi:dolichol-phosphate mannosyltransferase